MKCLHLALRLEKFGGGREALAKNLSVDLAGQTKGGAVARLCGQMTLAGLVFPNGHSVCWSAVNLSLCIAYPRRYTVLTVCERTQRGGTRPWQMNSPIRSTSRTRSDRKSTR